MAHPICGEAQETYFEGGTPPEVCLLAPSDNPKHQIDDQYVIDFADVSSGRWQIAITKEQAESIARARPEVEIEV